MSTLAGSIERIVFQNPESGFTVARLAASDRSKKSRGSLATVVGLLPALRPGEVVGLEGEWYDHPRHGATFWVKEYDVALPAEQSAIRKYLASGWIRGLGAVKAKAIAEHFGEETLRVLAKEPDRLAEVKGIGIAQARAIGEAWQEQAATRDVADFLRQFGLDISLAPVIFNVYGAQAVEFIKRNPYRLTQDFEQVSFDAVERMVREFGYPVEGKDRVASAARHVLVSMSEDGHVFVPCDVLVDRVVKMLRVDREAVGEALAHLRQTKQVIVEPPSKGEDGADHIYLTAYSLLEAGVARHLAAILDTPVGLAEALDWEAFFACCEREEQIDLDTQQREAIRLAATSKACIITGGPGVGKTTALRVLTRALRKMDQGYCLAAPTGRAAKRLSEVTGETATTIHRLLGYQPGTGRFKLDGTTPLPFRFVIVDEASMLDLSLTSSLLKAIPPDAHLVLVGDADQLPSVGPGNVLSDLIASDCLPVARLTRLFRQAQGGQLLVNAHRINSGLAPILHNRGDSDFFLVPAEGSAEVAATIVGLVKSRLPRSFGLDDISDIQVLSPLYGGAAGVTNLNQLLQAELNPPHAGAAELKFGGQVLREGDKVMQTCNDYTKGVYNGDLGRIVHIDRRRGRVIVRYGQDSLGDRQSTLRITYDSRELDEIVLAYAVSVHKAQGSEYPVVVMPAILEHQNVLQRSLLYTAITRAKRLCVLVGCADALVFATSRNPMQHRCTALTERLRASVAKAATAT